MRLLLLSLLLLSLSAPVPAGAAGTGAAVRVYRAEDGIACGELWLNGQIFWRVELLPDGAKPAVTDARDRTTTIAPDLTDGYFSLRFFNR